MGWKIVVCDDEDLVIEKSKSFIKEFSNQYREKIESKYYTSIQKFIKEMPSADVLFLDIRFADEETNGIKAAKLFRQFNPTAIIIFITTMTGYAIEGYQVHAYGFLDKPVEYSRFAKILSDSLQALHYREGKKIEIKYGASISLLNTKDIIYIEAFDHDIKVVTIGRSYPTSSTLSTLESQLKDKHFFRCYKSYLINIAYIKNLIGNQVELSTGQLIPVSKLKRKELLFEMASYQEEFL